LAPLALAAIVFIAASAAPAAAQTMETEAFLSSPAARAYLEGRYADALAALTALQASYPDDITIMRVTGMALYNLERYPQAARTLRRVVERDPEDAAAQFWLGATLFKLPDPAAAAAAFARAAELAPGTPYAQNAAQFIAAIERQAKAPKPWAIELGAGAQYDDNVSLTHQATIHSVRLFEQLDGSYLLIQRPGWRLAALGSGYFSQNTDSDRDEFGNDANDYDVVKGNWGLDLRRETSLLGIAVAAGATYTYDLVRQDNDRFSDIHTLTPWLEAGLVKNTVSRVYYTQNWDFFENEGFNFNFSSRDGERQTYGLAHYVYLDGQRRHYLWGGYEYRQTFASGVNFDAGEHVAAGGVSLTLPRDMTLGGGVRYAFADYQNFLGPPGRSSAQQTYSAELTRKLGDDLEATLGYSYAVDDSNYRDLETARNLATLALTWSF